METQQDNEEDTQDYGFFYYPEERQELFDYSKAIAEYLRTEEIQNLVIIDRSSRPLYIGVREYLASQYPSEKMPSIYFMNPKGFKTKEELTPEEIEEIGDISVVRSREDVFREFQKVYRRLIRDKDQPVLIFDTCIHSGKTLAPVKKVFDDAGFSDVRIGSVNPSNTESKIKANFYITRQRPEKCCYPFNRDKIVEKTFSHVHSTRTTDKRRRDQSILLREEIRQIIRKYLT